MRTRSRAGPHLSGFDWADVTEGAFPKIAEELSELREAIAAGDADLRNRGAGARPSASGGASPSDGPGNGALAVRDELGDLLFAVVNVARHLKVDPEAALREATAKFRRRFTAVETLAAERGLDLSHLDLAALDELWEEVKAPALTRDSSSAEPSCLQP